MLKLKKDDFSSNRALADPEKRIYVFYQEKGSVSKARKSSMRSRSRSKFFKVSTIRSQSSKMDRTIFDRNILMPYPATKFSENKRRSIYQPL